MSRSSCYRAVFRITPAARKMCTSVHAHSAGHPWPAGDDLSQTPRSTTSTGQAARATMHHKAPAQRDETTNRRVAHEPARGRGGREPEAGGDPLPSRSAARTRPDSPPNGQESPIRGGSGSSTASCAVTTFVVDTVCMAVPPVLVAGARTPTNGLQSPYTLPSGADEGGRTATSSSTPTGTTSASRPRWGNGADQTPYCASVTLSR